VRPAVLAAAAAVLLALCAFALAPRLHRFAYWIARKSGAQVQALARDGWRVDRFAPEPGVELVGLVRPPAGAGARWILFLPGNSNDLLAGFQQVLDPLRARGDVGLAFWAYRGFDASTGVPSPEALRADAGRCWRRLLAMPGVEPANVELWGYSLGSGLAVQLAAELCAQSAPPARVVLLSAYDRITVMRGGLLGRLQPGDVYDAMPAAPHITCDVVLVHGTADDALPLAGARALLRALGPRARLVELAGKGHADYLQDLDSLAALQRD
jgi:pimeloyl-ACP methyl ester carboxylesterase